MTEPSLADDRQSVASTIWWWCITLVTLAVIDDLTFGPFFWAISRTAGPWWAVAAIYCIYVPGQMLVIRKGTEASPGKVASWFLRRLNLERRAAPVQRNEEAVRSRVVGVTSALLLTLLIGGVLPPLLLWRRGYPRHMVLRVGLATSVLYATEFAVLHGLVPAAI